MNTNIIRDANEILNDGTIVYGVKYIEKILSIKSDTDKDSCFRLLTFENRHLKLCHNEYNDKINGTDRDGIPCKHSPYHGIPCKHSPYHIQT